jgi:photosystem II stability/assembly factor-like uncharacterized protein
MFKILTFIIGFIMATLLARASEWTPISTPANLDLISADFHDHEYGWMVGAGGRAFRTTDGGRNWVRQDIGVDVMLIKVDVVDRDKYAFLTTDNEVIVHMQGSVRRTTPVPNAILYDIAYLNQNTLIVVGQIGRAGRGVIARSTDGGRTWREIGHGGGNSTLMYTALHFVTPNEGYMAGARPRQGGGHTPIIGKTMDGGLTWRGLYGSSMSSEDLLPTDITSFGVFRIVVAGTSTDQMEGHMLRSTDAGERWNRLDDPVYAKVTSLAAYNHRVGFATTTWKQSRNGEMPEDRPMILRTDDDGQTWQNDHGEFTAATLHGVACARGAFAIAFGSNGRVLRRSFECDEPQLIRSLPARLRRPLGSITTINATATTNNVVYRWRKDGVILENTEPTLTLYRVRANDAGEYEVTISNECGSTVARTTVETFESGVLVAQRGAVDFGYREVGTSYDTVLQGLFRNEGSEQVRIHRVKAFGGEGAFAILTEHVGVVLQPGESLDVAIRYRPDNMKAHFGVIDVDTDSDVDPTVYLTGAATSRDHIAGLDIAKPVRFATAEPQMMVDTLIRSVIVNTGTSDITVRMAEVGGENAMHFALREPFEHPVTLAPGSALDLGLVFAPTYRGTFRGELDLLVDDRSIVIPLSGISGELADGEVVNFGPVAPGSTRDTVLTFHHVYDTDLTLKEISDIGQPFEVVETYPPLPVTLGGWHFVTARIRFRPTAAGVTAMPIRLHWEDAQGNRFNSLRRVLRGGIDGTTSVDDDAAESDVRIHPVPARDVVHVTTASGVEISSIELRDVRGVLLAGRVAFDGAAATVRVTGLASGIYILTITDDRGHARTERLIVE